MKLKFEKAPDDVLPKCPFCKYPLDRIWEISKGRGIVEQQQVMICPQCESVLGFCAHAH